MPELTDIFDVEHADDTAILIPRTDMGELDFEQIEQGAQGVLDLLDNKHVKSVVVDFHRTDYCGSTALAFFVRLWKRVRSHNGHMAFCNVSALEREILAITKLDTLWSVCGSREEAICTPSMNGLISNQWSLTTTYARHIFRENSRYQIVNRAISIVFAFFHPHLTGNRPCPLIPKSIASKTR